MLPFLSLSRIRTIRNQKSQLAFTTFYLLFTELFSAYFIISKRNSYSSYLKGSQHAARNQYQEPEVHVEELGDFISHKNRKNQ